MTILTTTESSMTTNTERRATSKSPTVTSEQHSQTASPSSTTDSMIMAMEIEDTSTMNAEIDAAVTFLTDLIKAAQFSTQLAEQFRKGLTVLLKDYYNGHWYPEEPLKGSGYRCLVSDLHHIQ